MIVTVVIAVTAVFRITVLSDKLSGNINFIDYEYASYNYRGFDLGNHFNEFAGICI
jgi:ethanolamine kinase